MKTALQKIHAESERRRNFMPFQTPRYIRCYDNGGETFDRITVVFTNLKRRLGYHPFIGSSENGTGFYCHGESQDILDRPSYAHLGKRIKFDDLTVELQARIREAYEYYWDL